MAHRGVDTLRFGPMKPVGLVDPRTGREPYAAVQLRQDNLAGDHYSLVGFPDAAQMGRAGARAAADSRARAGGIRALRHGAPQHLRQRSDRARRDVAGPAAVRRCFFAGQMSGVEGYVESAASGLLAGLNAAALASGRPISSPPRTTAIGALAYYVSHADPAHYEPSNITFGIMEPLARRAARQDGAQAGAVGAGAGRPASGGWTAGSVARTLAPGHRRRTPTARSVPTPTIRARDDMTEHLKAFLSFLRLNRNAVGAYRARLRQRSLAVPRSRRGGRRRQARELAPAALDRARHPQLIWPTLHAHGQSRATAARKLAAVRTLPPLPAARGAHRRRSGRARRHAEARSADAGASRPKTRCCACSTAPSDDDAARPPRSRDPRAVLRVGASPQRARGARSRGRESERAGWCGCSAKAASSGWCRSTPAPRPRSART